MTPNVALHPTAPTGVMVCAWRGAFRERSLSRQVRGRADG
jgi:hypothetical protein